MIQPSFAPASPLDDALLAVRWRRRAAPMAPAAVAAVDAETAARLRKRLLDRDDAALAALTGVHGSAFLLVLGAAADLPWVDGALYLGQDSAAPGVLLPTTLVPSVPVPLLLRALQKRFSALAPPLAILPEGGATGSRIVPLAAARPVTRQALLASSTGTG